MRRLHQRGRNVRFPPIAVIRNFGDEYLVLSHLLFLFVATAADAPPATVDPERFARHIASDADVLRSLADNGDDPSVERLVDVRFVGPRRAISALETKIDDFGWAVVERVQYDDGTDALDVQRKQKTDPHTIRKMTEQALQIEAQFAVIYDGWGTVATAR